MSTLKGGLILLVVFIASVFAAFYFEESYRKAIRQLYVTLSGGKISFFVPRKNLHFASSAFVLSFGIFMTAISFLFYRQSSKQRLVNLSSGLALFVLSVLVHCYVDSLFKIITCTACADGTRRLHYNDINYDGIFISSLALAIVPFAATEIRKFIKKKRQTTNHRRVSM